MTRKIFSIAMTPYNIVNIVGFIVLVTCQIAAVLYLLDLKGLL
jgi:hypothetical protein